MISSRQQRASWGGRITGRTTPRHGAILIIVLVCFALAATLFALLARSTLSNRQTAEREAWRLEAQWLAEAGVERALARRTADPGYVGETWTLAAEEFDGDHGGVVRIVVTPDADAPRRQWVRVEAIFPDDPLHRCRWEKQVLVGE